MTRARRLWNVAPSLLAGFLVPAVVYWLVRPRVGGDAEPLAIGGAIPAAWTVGRLVLRRRLDPIGLLGTAGFAVGLVISLLTGGSALPLKLHDAVVTGAIGLACLVSVAIRKPILAFVLPLLGRGTWERRAMAVATAIAGVTLVIHAAAHTVVALTLATSAFLVASRVVGLPIYVAGGVALFWYLRRQAGAAAREPAA